MSDKALLVMDMQDNTQCFEDPCNGFGCHKELCDHMNAVCEKLAGYEETGLTPEQVRFYTYSLSHKKD